MTASSGGNYEYVGDDPGGVELAVTDLRGVGEAMARLAGEVEHDTRSIKEHWPGGHTGQVAAGDAARIGGALGECHQVFGGAEGALGELHVTLVTGRRRVDELNRAYRVLSVALGDYEARSFLYVAGPASQAGLQPVEDALGMARTRSGYDSLADIDSAYAQLVAQVRAETGICNTLLRRLTTQGAAPAGHAGGESKFDVSFGLLAAASAGEVADILDGDVDFPIDSTKADPKTVHDAWMLLSPDQRAALIKAQPARFGNLNGIPAADRDVANRATLTAQLDRLAAACQGAGIEPPRSLADFERLFPPTLAMLEAISGLSAQEARQALLLQAQLRRGGGIPTLLLAYEPGAYGGKGRAAIAFGDVDHADNIAVCVPGLNSGLHNVNQVTGDAMSLYEQAYQADRGRHTAVVAWQGYDAPGLHNVASQNAAEAGAKLLAADVNAMRTTHDGPIGTLTVVGHSYGSTTTGLALQREHMDLDQVVLIGSPGVGGRASTVADLGLDKSRMFVGSASRDIVTTVPDSLGEDPSEDTFGATRFQAESIGRSWHTSFADHSRYYDAVNHSESLYALADIVTGHGDRLGQDGMLAKPRHLQPGIGLRGMPAELVVDPEASRTPTAGHDHADDVGRPSP